MKKADRFDWIIDYLFKGGRYASVNILDQAFVDAYEAATGASVKVQMYGANKCPQLARDLSELYTDYRLCRTVVSLPPGSANLGFPRWVYSYRL